MSILKKISCSIFNVMGRSVGYAELLGLRYPVHPYQFQVDDRLWRGSRIDRTERWAELRVLGIRHVINLCMEDERDWIPFSVPYTRIPILDNATPTRAQILEFFYAVDELSPAYVHCEAGRGRTGVMVACYRMHTGWDKNRAIQEAKFFGLEIPAQIEFLETYS